MTRATHQIIRGAGGGGKGGGGSSHTPSEAPNTLRSKQVARVLDLVCEGPVGGLVDGLRSVYLDGVPVMNADGSRNFTGVTARWRHGTPNQSYIPDFSAAESEHAVGLEVKAGTPVVRTITDPDVTAARVTVSVPQLTFQDPTTGDLRGTSVEIAVDVQSAGGGFVAQRLTTTQIPIAVNAGTSQVTLPQATTRLAAGVAVDFGSPVGVVSCTVVVEYRQVGAGSWTLLDTAVISSTEARRVPAVQQYPFYGLTQPGWTTLLGTGGGAAALIGTGALQPVQRVFEVDALPSAVYEVRARKAAGTGTVTLGYVALYAGTYTDRIDGKTMSRYQRAYRIALAGSPPWDVRVRRITADSTQANLVDKTYFDSYTELVDAKLRYPMSAVIGLELDATQFRAVPQRGYEMRLLQVEVPSNYDPAKRVYTGTWDGTFQIAWSDNPAWCLRDLIINERYGLGEFIDADAVDKWALYVVAQYCDELVPDGFGGQEPRFTCNLYLQSRQEAYQVLQDMTSIFRGMMYWSAGALTAVHDAPADPIAQYTPANVIGGIFRYEGSARTARHTVALVGWNDPDDGYRRHVEYVEDETGIARYGIVETEVLAVGCTSRGQAHRLGKMILHAERVETETVSFRTGLDGAFVYPGAIIQTQDPARAGLRLGGRLVAATTTELTLDAAVTIETAKFYTVSVMLPDGTLAERDVTNSPGSTSVLTLASALPQVPQVHAIWVLAISDLVPETWRVVAVIEPELGQYEITALAYDAARYAAVEQDIVLEPAPTSILSVTPPAPPGGLTVTESLYLVTVAVVGNRATLSWQASAGALRYRPAWRPAGGQWQRLPDTDEMSVDVDGLQPGMHEFRVTAVNALGYESQPATRTVELRGKTAPPEAVADFTVMAIAGLAQVSWSLHPDLDVRIGGTIEIRYSTKTSGATWADGIPVASAPGAQQVMLVPLATGTYLARARDSSGFLSAATAAFVATEALVTGFTTVATSTQHATFAGTKTGTVVDGGALKLANAGLWDDITDLDALAEMVDEAGGINSSGSYAFAAPVDLGVVKSVRLFGSITALASDVGDLWDARTLAIDEWDDVDGADIDDCGATLYVRTTDDDPGGAPTWGPWSPFYVGDYRGRGLDFRLDLVSGDPSHNIAISTLSVTAKEPA
ncbi:MAG: host specificity protein J [Gammaproteobacteria bacterium]|nr:host specificity protein J [Gammaproteobacteria bacterium]